MSKDSRDYDNWAERMRLCLFIELQVQELYESGGANQCPRLSWSETEVFGDRWMIAECNRIAQKKQIRMGNQAFNTCLYTCTKRKSDPIKGFFSEVSKRVREWKRNLIYDHLGRLEEEQLQRPVGPYVISL